MTIPINNFLRQLAGMSESLKLVIEYAEGMTSIENATKEAVAHIAKMNADCDAYVAEQRKLVEQAKLAITEADIKGVEERAKLIEFAHEKAQAIIDEANNAAEERLQKMATDADELVGMVGKRADELTIKAAELDVLIAEKSALLADKEAALSSLLDNIKKLRG